MIDFAPMQDGEITYLEYAEREGIDAEALRKFSDESIKHLLALLDGLTDMRISKMRRRIRKPTIRTR